MSIYWHFLAKEGIFVRPWSRPVTRSILLDRFLSNKLKSWPQNDVSRARAGLPSKAGGGIQWMAVWRGAKTRAAQAMGFQYSQTVANLFFVWSEVAHKIERCAWKVLNLYLTQAVPYDDAKPGAAIAVQSFDDFQNFNPHLHALATDGCFYNDAAFMVCSPPDTGELEILFRYEVFKMLRAEGKITDVVIENMMNWHHSGFNVYCGYIT